MAIPDDIKRGQLIKAEWLNDVKNAIVKSFHGGRGLNIKRMGSNVLFELTGHQIIPSFPPFLFLAEITGNATLGSAGARWKYAWREVEFDGDSYATKTGGRSGTTGAAAGTDLGYALNLNEMTLTVAKSGTTAWYIDGTQSNASTAGSAYPTGHAPRPIGGGGTANTHRVNVLVWMRDTFDKNGNRRFYFKDKMNQDGACA